MMNRASDEGMYGGQQHQGLHDDWWSYYEHSNDRADQCWPHHRDIKMPTKKGKEQAERTVYTAIPNMAESLKSNMHHRRKIGMSDTSTTYYSSWQSKLNIIDEAHSHMFMTSRKVTPSKQHNENACCSIVMDYCPPTNCYTDTKR
jgi:hypothetical protein